MITIQEFAAEQHISEKTISKNISRIKGVVAENGEIKFIDGTRYPVNKSHVSYKDSLNRYYSVIKATSKNKYIGKEYLHIDDNSFHTIINELVKEGYLIDKGNNNPYGANKYDLSIKGANLLFQSKYQILKELAAVFGTFFGVAGKELLFPRNTFEKMIYQK